MSRPEEAKGPAVAEGVNPPSPLRDDLNDLVRRLVTRFGLKKRPPYEVLAPLVGFASGPALATHMKAAPSKKVRCVTSEGRKHERRIVILRAILNDEQPGPPGVGWCDMKADGKKWLPWWDAQKLVARRTASTEREPAGTVAAVPAVVPAVVPAPVPSNVIPLRPEQPELPMPAAPADPTVAEYRRKFMAGQAMGNRLAKETLDALEVARDNARDNTGRVLEALERIEGLLGRLLACWEPRS